MVTPTLDAGPGRPRLVGSICTLHAAFAAEALPALEFDGHDNATSETQFKSRATVAALPAPSTLPPMAIDRLGRFVFACRRD